LIESKNTLFMQQAINRLGLKGRAVCECIDISSCANFLQVAVQPSDTNSKQSIPEYNTYGEDPSSVSCAVTTSCDRVLPFAFVSDPRPAISARLSKELIVLGGALWKQAMCNGVFPQSSVTRSKYFKFIFISVFSLGLHRASLTVAMISS
jgi:hypothetical protein